MIVSFLWFFYANMRHFIVPVETYILTKRILVGFLLNVYATPR